MLLVGTSALTANTTGAANTAIGRQTLFFNTTGNNNTAIGFAALCS
jgi:trimeric autotransporter adhesin